MDLSAKNQLKILVYMVLKNWTTVIKFIIAIACLKFFVEVVDSLSLNNIL